MCRLSHISGHFRLNLSDHERVKVRSFSPHAFMRFSGVSAFQRSHCKDTTRLSGCNRTRQKLKKLCFKIFALVDYQVVTKFYLWIIVLFIGHKNKRTFD